MRYVLILALIITLFPYNALAREKILDIQEIASPAGITAWLVEDHAVPIIALKFAFKDSGAAHDPEEKQGLTQLASNTMDEGAGEIPSREFQKILRDEAITLRFYAGRDSFGGEIKTLAQRKDKAFELLKLALTAPRFDEEPVERMRRANQSRLRSALSDPDWIAARLMNDKAFAGHPYALNSGGTLRTLENITPEDLRGFVKTRLAKDRLMIGAAGDITPEALKTLLDEVFGSLPATSPLEETPDHSLQNTGNLYLFEKEIPQTIIEIRQPGISAQDPDYQAAQVMNFILGSSGFGSRLMEEVREKRGLSYGIYANLSPLDHLPTLGISTATENKNVAEVLALIKTEWENMKTLPPSEDELKTAKSYLIGSLPLSLTSTNAIADILLSLQLEGRSLDYLETRREEIEKTSAADVQNLAAKLLDENRFVSVLVGKPEGLENAHIIKDIPHAE